MRIKTHNGLEYLLINFAGVVTIVHIGGATIVLSSNHNLAFNSLEALPCKDESRVTIFGAAC